MRERAALLLLAAGGLAMCWHTPAGAAVAVAALGAHAAQEAFRFRGELKLVKDAGAALLRHEARLNSLERALEAATTERIG